MTIVGKIKFSKSFAAHFVNNVEPTKPGIL